MKTKPTIGLLFGGNSLEHEISCISAWWALSNIDLSRYHVIPIAIDKKGAWHVLCMEAILPYLGKSEPLIKEVKDRFSLHPDWLDLESETPGELFSPSWTMQNLDAAFMVMHSFPGEDGALAGLFNYLGVPVVGSDRLSLALCMDKGVSKRLVQSEGIEVAPFSILKEKSAAQIDKLISELGLPLFIKPIDSGSSVGISKAYNKEQAIEAVHEAFAFSNQVIVESYVKGRELEVAVLEVEGQLKACPIGEVVVGCDFYSYSAKYDKSSPAYTQFPQDIDQEVYVGIQEKAVTIFKALGCRGGARIDFFLKEDGSAVFNEINTVPGLTPISLFPLMAQKQGIDGKNLITLLIEASLKREKVSC